MTPFGRIGAGASSSATVATLVFASAAAVVVVVVAVFVTEEEPGLRLVDLAVGVAFLLLAVAALPRSRPLAAVSALVAVAWWAGSLWPVAVFWHRGPLVHLLVAFPSVWPPVAWVRTVVAAGYLVGLSPAAWGNEVAAVALATGLIIARIARAGRAAPLIGTVMVSLAVIGDAAARTFVPRSAAVRPSFVVFSVALVGAATLLGRELRRADTEQVTDLVVQLAEQGSAELRHELATALGDSTLRLGFAREGVFIDEDGNVVAPADPRDDRRSIIIERDGGPAMLVVHNSSSQDEPALRDAVERWAVMSRANADLRERTQRSIDEVAASRRRLLIAADEERERLARHIDESVTAPLRTLTRRLATHSPPADQILAERFRTVLDRLDRAADGLAPAGLQDGLRPALNELASVSPISIAVEVEEARFGPAVELAIYYVCAEALANVVKHGSASRVEMRASADGERVVVTVCDDGRGGAVVGRPGSGLAGLADRVAALGGTLSVDSHPGAGTTVRASFPLGSCH